MSSAILYIGIVAIWAFVLVPRWLRRHPDQSEVPADDDAGTEAGSASDHQRGPDRADSDDRGRRASARAAQSAFGGSSSQPIAHAETPTPSRSRVLQARRRLLTMLLALTGGAAACFLLKLTPWWAVVPPAGMLSLFVLLLREATVADAEQARRRAAQAVRVRAARQHAGVAARVTWSEPPGPSAEVIDISARVGDQLYDQYADATIRAVGD
jgi:hypothetical protein